MTEPIDTCHKDIVRLGGEIRALEKLVAEQFRGRDEALRVALTEMKDRLISMNELRGVVTDQAQDFIRISTYNAAHDGLVRDVAQIRETMANKAEVGVLSERLAKADLALVGWNSRITTAGAIFMALGGVIVYFISRVFGH